MKLKYIITTLLATAVFATSCQEDIERHLSEVQVSSSYVAIPAEGGSKTITVTATAEWNIENVPSWLTVSPVSGVAGETEVSFKADAATSTNEVTLRLLCSGKTQELNVLQQTEKVDLPISTCKEVNSGTDGVTYRIKGTVTRIVNTTYGNMYVSDGTDEVYVYGTLDASGAEKNFLSLGIEVGDIVTVEGPKTTYSGTIELVNVSVIAIEKSLIKVDSVDPESAELPVEGGSFAVTLTNKGDGVSVSVPADAKSWLTLEGISTSGTETVVKFEAAANEGGDRETTISFTTTSNGKEYSASASLSQKGSIIETTIDKILAAEDGTAQYKTTGYITKVANTTYGNIYVKDATGEIYVYGVLDSKGQSKQWASMGISEGDIITVVGPKSSFNGTAQLKNVTVDSFKKVTEASVKDFLAAEVKSDVYYRLSGTVSGVKDSDVYGNIYLTDANGDKVYVYGLLAGWGGAKKEFQKLGIKEGDTITIVGVRAAFGDTAQVGSAFLVAHTPAGENV